MAKFVLIDQSLTGVEGHHYEYDVNVLQAGADAGYEPVLAANKLFRRTPEMPSNWRVLSLFPHTSYSKYTVFSGIGERSLDFRKPLFKPWSERPDKLRWLSAALDWRNYLKDYKFTRRREYRIHRFASACRKLFSEVSMNADDLVFVPTATEFDFECLINFLESSRQSQRIAWHVQFHFNYLEGREPTYAEQSPRFAAMRAYFENLLARAENHKLFLYTTSQSLAEQYGLMGVAEFQMLPYPVSVQLAPRIRNQQHGRLRVTSAGCIRPEKGHQHLNGLVQSLWRDYFAMGRLQLVLQTDQPNPLSMIPWASYARSRTADPAIEFVKFPLPRTDYLELIRHTHVGLFAYDSERYYTRCSGVLVEMLSAGIPVIVPAGCWLADQIADEVYRHQEQMGRELPHVREFESRELRWAHVNGTPVTNRNEPVTVAGAGAGLITEITADRHASDLLTLIDSRRWPDGSYVRMICEQLDGEMQMIDRSAVVVGNRRDSHCRSPMLVHLFPTTSRIRLTFENAFYQHTLPLDDLRLVMLDASKRVGGCPIGNVGLIAADPGEFASLLREMVENYSHYASTAQQFAAAWHRKHDPAQTIAQLRQRAAKNVEVRRSAA